MLFSLKINIKVHVSLFEIDMFLNLITSIFIFFPVIVQYKVCILYKITTIFVCKMVLLKNVGLFEKKTKRCVVFALVEK